MRLVDTDALLLPDDNSDKVLVIGPNSGKTLHIAYGLLKLKVKNAPTIDPVHAAGGCYCRECIYATRPGDNIVHCDNFERDMMPDDYCSVGERREAAE